MTEWNLEVDTLIVGSGAAGLSAGICCAQAGLKALVLEKTAFYGGSTAISGGVVWIPENEEMAREGMPDTPGAAKTYLQNTLGSNFQEHLISAFIANGPKMVHFFGDNTDVKLIPRMYAPDYQSELPGASYGGRALDPAEYDGRKLGQWFSLLRAPLNQMTAFNGMMVSRYDIDHLLHMWKRWPSFIHGLKILIRYIADRFRYSRGTRLLAGNALAASLLKSAIDSGVELKNDSKVVRLIVENGRVIGVVADCDGKRIKIHARKGVVLAAGGSAGNSEMTKKLVPYPSQHLSMSPEGSQGDGLVLAQTIGAVIGKENMNNVLLTPVSVMKNKNGEEVRFPHLILDRQKPGLVAVNSEGERFVNEANSYHDFVEGMLRAHLKKPAIPAYLICDARFISKYGLGMVRPWPFPLRPFIKKGYLTSAPSLGELAKKLSLPEDALSKTVERMNEFSQTGIDEDFGRGSTEYNRYLGDPNNKPNACLGDIKTAPFFAVKVYPGDIGSATGLVTDECARVINHEGDVISGLYACGNDMNSIMAGHYPAGGITLGPAMTFGFIAAQGMIQ